MKYTISESLNKRELQLFNGDEKFIDMIKRKAAIELAKHFINHLDVQTEDVETQESDEAELIKVSFSVNVFSDLQLNTTYEPIEIDSN